MGKGHGVLNHTGRSSSVPCEEYPRARDAISIIDPVWDQFATLLPSRPVVHPLGCHRPRIPDRIVFDKLAEVLVFGCAYWRIADESCSATTLRRRRDEWIEGGLMDELRQMALNAYDWTIGLGLYGAISALWLSPGWGSATQFPPTYD